MKEIQENIGIKEQLLIFGERIDNYRTTLNIGGVWLFLATLGCWGVDDPEIKMIAVIFTYLIFTHRLFVGIKSVRLFSSDIKKYKNDINTSDILEDQKKPHRDELKILEKKLSLLSALKDNPSYYLGIIFLFVSFWHWYGSLILQVLIN